MTTVFFYGLFMDEHLLKQKGLNPESIRLACLDGYQLRIGERATLVPHRGMSSYGAVMRLSQRELEQLYSSDGVEDYVPDSVQVRVINDELVDAVTYVLPIERILGSNSEYAVKLAHTAEALGLPSAYVDEIKGWT
ncbi:gamma-glutamylcyclotransferase [bacterium SCSIO 12696]|nr:gamma-glutamylcyclotransferase [bacterium SCSIO 12696]